MRRVYVVAGEYLRSGDEHMAGLAFLKTATSATVAIQVIQSRDACALLRLVCKPGRNNPFGA